MGSRHKSGIEIDRKSKGKQGEERAVRWLLELGHEILEQNYVVGKSEIDIISLRDNKLLVFTEVKARKSSDYGHPEEFVSDGQRDRILRAADQYVHDINWMGEVRFDIISVKADSDELQHFKDAFY